MKNKNITELANRYREAWLTSQRLESDMQLGYASGWPEMVYDKREQIRRAEQESLKGRPTPEAVDRMVECINWLMILDDDARKLIWLKASGLDWRSIATRSGIPRSTIYRRWHKNLLKISLAQPNEAKNPKTDMVR